MKLGFYGAAHEVTGSCTLIEAGGVKGIVDCGMEQGKDVLIVGHGAMNLSIICRIRKLHVHV